MAIVKRPVGTTRVLGKSQGYAGLPIVDSLHPEYGPMMTSHWELTPSEIAALARGGTLVITLLGTGHPPIHVSVKGTDE